MKGTVSIEGNEEAACYVTCVPNTLLQPQDCLFPCLYKQIIPYLHVQYTVFLKVNPRLRNM